LPANASVELISEGARKVDGRWKPPTNFGHLIGDLLGMTFRKLARFARSVAAVGGVAFVLAILLAVPAFAASDLNTVIDSVRDWVAGLLIALATLFLTVGGVRYLTAQGNPRAVEEAKAGIKAALIGYGLAALAPTLVSILQKVLRT
jgi:anaerobic C4-dicarboxylate transporter